MCAFTRRPPRGRYGPPDEGLLRGAVGAAPRASSSPPDREPRAGVPALRACVRAIARSISAAATGEFTAELAAAGAVGGRGGRRRGGARAGPVVSTPALDFTLVGIDGPLPFEDNSFDARLGERGDRARRRHGPLALGGQARARALGDGCSLTTPSHGRLRLAARRDRALLAAARRPPAPVHAPLADRGAARVRLRAMSRCRRWRGPPLLRRLLLARAVR